MDQASGDRPATAVDELKTHWRRHVRKAVEQPYLMALLAGSLLLSFASFFTTFSGMLNFMPVWLITFCIVFAIQALLFVTSWRIGFSVADRERLPIFTLFVFAICLATSVFFSWVALFEQINDAEAQTRTRTARMQRAAQDVSTEIQTRIQARQREAVKDLLASPEYAGWRGSVEQVAQTAMDARDALETALRDQALASADRIARLEAERAGILAEQAAAGEMKASRERELERLAAKRPALLERLQTLEEEVAVAEEAVLVQEGKMEAEATGGASGKGTGRGPVWRQLRDERNVLAAKRGAKQALRDRAEQALVELDNEIADTRAGIAGAGAAATAARLAVIEQTIAQIQSGGLADDPTAGLEAKVAAIRGDLASMASRADLEPLDRAAAGCAEILAALKNQASLADRAGGLSCDRGALAARLAPIRAQAQAESRMAAQCSSGGAEAQVIATLGYDAALALTGKCMDLSGLPADALSDLRARVSQLVLEEAPDASQFVKTANAWKEGDKLAYFALAIALFIDLLVLFSGLIGALSGASAITQHFDRSFNRRKADNFVRALTLRLEADAADDEELWTTRAILRNAEPFLSDERGLREFTAQIDLARLDDPQLKGAIRQFLLGLYTDKLARPDATAPATRFLLKTSVLDALRHHLFEEGANPERRAARIAAAAATPRPVAPSDPAPQPMEAVRSTRRVASRASRQSVGKDAPTTALDAREPADAANVVPLRREAPPARAADSNVAPIGDFELQSFLDNINTKLAERRDQPGEADPAAKKAERRPSASGES